MGGRDMRKLVFSSPFKGEVRKGMGVSRNSIVISYNLGKRS